MSDKNMPPDFILIGAAKCGTTAMYDMLCQHPGVYGSPVKEPHYFSDFDIDKFSVDFRRNNVIDSDTYFAQFPLPDQFQLFVSKRDQYLRLFENAGEGLIRGEASTSYLYAKRAPAAIAEHNPDVRLIAILRHPVDRAFSHYVMALKYGYTSGDFWTAIQRDREARIKGWGISELFLELGNYHEQIERFFQYFSRDQIHLILFEEWKAQPQKVINQLTDFLGLSRFDQIHPTVQNAGELPRFARFNRWMHRLGIRQFLADHIPLPVKDNLRSFYLKPKTELPMDERTREFLAEYYRPGIERLEQLWDRDLTIWKD